MSRTSEFIQNLGSKTWKLRSRHLTLHLINVDEINATKINANFLTSRKFHEAFISYTKVIVLFAVKTFKLMVKHKTREHFHEYIPREA